MTFALFGTKARRMNARALQMPRALATTAVLLYVVGCEAEQPLTGTGPFVTTGLLDVSGRVQSADGVPLPAFRVFAVVNADSIRNIYPSIPPVVSGATGAYSTQLQRFIDWLPPEAPDSVQIRLAAESVRPEDHNVDWSRRRVEMKAWAKFVRPPQAPGVLVVDFVIPNKR